MDKETELEQEPKMINENDEIVPSENLNPNEILLEKFKELKITVGVLREEMEVKINNITESVKTYDSKIEDLYIQKRGFKSDQRDARAGVEQTLQIEQALIDVNVNNKSVQFNCLNPNEKLLGEFKETVGGLLAKYQAMEIKINDLTEKFDLLNKDLQNRGYESGQGEAHTGVLQSGIRVSATPAEHVINLIIPTADINALTELSKQPSVCYPNNEYQSVFEKFKTKFGLQDLSNRDSDPEIIFVLRTCSMRVEDEAKTAIEAFSQDQCSRVVLVLFYRTLQPTEADEGKASYYERPGIRKTFHIKYYEKDKKSKCAQS